LNCTAALPQDLGQAVQWIVALNSTALLKRTAVSDVTSAKKNVSVYTFWTSAASSAKKNKPYSSCVSYIHEYHRFSVLSINFRIQSLISR